MWRAFWFSVCFFVYVATYADVFHTLSFEQIEVKGELQQRLERNLQRLQEEKYQPDNVFLTMEQSGDWPGDTEGRTILGLVLDAQASHKEPLYLNEIIRFLPFHLNEKGYMGPVFHDFIHEQQLSGNGWMLRGLCEYYLWKKDPSILKIIRTISRNLFLNGKGKYSSYPINPAERILDKGEASGNISQTVHGWKLSSDIGCVFIGLDGLVQAYGILNDKALKPVIEEMINRFLQIDLLAIKAQTHASLTAFRALVRYAEITGKMRLVNEAAKRFDLYCSNGMTENFENYNWFGRFDTWTEPCAIVDSYMLAVQLWMHTGDVKYLEYAEQIYYNALCRTQRYNGGFGCDNCPGAAHNTHSLTVHIPEAHWCCTMRGGEGLSRVASYSVFTKDKDVVIPFYRSCSFKIGNMLIEEKTHYPFGDAVVFKVREGEGKLNLSLPHYSWMDKVVVKINTHVLPLIEKNRFYQIAENVKCGDSLSVSFSQKMVFKPTMNRNNTVSTQRVAFYGPLQLGYKGVTPLKYLPTMQLEHHAEGIFIKGTPIELTPVYHLMDSSIWKKKENGIQVLF